MKKEACKHMAEQANGTVYQIKVTLRESKPLIWRRVQVPGNITLHKLHMILQSVMGWTNSHLYRFDIAGTQYSIPDPVEDDFSELHFVDSRRSRLSKVVSLEKAGFTYEYDFGDSWNHEILVEKMLPPEPGVQYPVCLAGKRACPPEDCGGIYGYYECLEALKNPDDPDYADRLEWIGDYDPDDFDPHRVNRVFARWRGR